VNGILSARGSATPQLGDRQPYTGRDFDPLLLGHPLGRHLWLAGTALAHAYPTGAVVSFDGDGSLAPHGSIRTEDMIRNTRARRVTRYGVSLALFAALAMPGIAGSSEGGIAFAQATGQPGTTPTPTDGGGQQPGVLVPVSGFFVDGMDGSMGGVSTTLIDEGGDIGEGLSNQRIDPDD
jgi:hypothetical protein